MWKYISFRWYIYIINCLNINICMLNDKKNIEKRWFLLQFLVILRLFSLTFPATFLNYSNRVKPLSPLEISFLHYDVIEYLFHPLIPWLPPSLWLPSNGSLGLDCWLLQQSTIGCLRFPHFTLQAKIHLKKPSELLTSMNSSMGCARCVVCMSDTSYG